MNRVSFSIVEGPNPVYGSWHPDQPFLMDLHHIDIQQVAGPILQDVEFISDYSEPSPRGGHTLRYCSLEDRLDEVNLQGLRNRTVELLLGVSKAHGCGGAWVLFSDMLKDGDEDEVSHYYTIRAYCEQAGVNGAMSLFEIEREDLSYFKRRFCAYDSIAGLAAPEDGIGDVLEALPLVDPWPSTRRNHRFSAAVTNTLSKLLEQERTFFFEEHDNGTRLRLVSRTLSREELESSVMEFLD